MRHWRTIEGLIEAVNLLRLDGPLSFAVLSTDLARRGMWAPALLPPEAQSEGRAAEDTATALILSTRRLDYRDVLRLREALESLLATIERIESRRQAGP